MRPLAFAILLTTFVSLSSHAESPDAQGREAIHNTDRTFAVAFNANGCQMCRTLAPALRDRAQRLEFMGITLFVAKFDTEKVLERSLGIADQRSTDAFKDGQQGEHRTAVTQYDTLSGHLQNVIR